MANIPLRLAGKDLKVLNEQERAMTGWTHMAKIAAADYLPGAAAAANDTISVSLFTAPAGTVCTKAVAWVTTGFETAVTLTCAVGTPADPDEYIDEFDPAATGIYNPKGHPFDGAGNTAATEIVVTFGPESGADLNSENTGVVYVYLRLDALPTW